MTTSEQTIDKGERGNLGAWFQKARTYGIVIALLLLVGFNIFRIYRVVSTNETIVESGNVNEAFVQALNSAFNVNLTQVATIVIVAVGMTLVIATGGIDLSVGAIMAIAGQLAPLIFMGPIAERFGIAFANALAIVVPIIVAVFLVYLTG